MGLCNSKIDNIHNNLLPFRIATIQVDIDDTINKKHKINTLIEYFMKPYFNNHIDVLCIQGIHNFYILKEIINAFKEKIYIYNTTNKKNIYVEYYPDIKQTNRTCSTEYDYTADYHNKIIISRHSILQSSDVHMQHIKNKYIQLVNLQVNGVYMSIYNVDLKEDNNGINNSKERHIQLNEIVKIIETNKQNTIQDTSRQYIYGDTTYIACDRNIHIVTGIFNIDKFKNAQLSNEYIKIGNILGGIDINQWIMTAKKDTNIYHTNARFTKNTYTYLICNNKDEEHFIKNIFSGHKLIIVNSTIATHIVDMNQFINYPEDTLLMLYKPQAIYKVPIKKIKIKIRKPFEIV